MARVQPDDGSPLAKVGCKLVSLPQHSTHASAPARVREAASSGHTPVERAPLKMSLITR